MSPTTRHYLASFVAGVLLVAVTILTDQFSAHPDGVIDWRLLGFSILGGVILFARDYLKNNLGAFLEGVAPAQVQSAVAQGGAQVLVPPAAQKPLDTLGPTESPPAH
jgi:hypothetical protein